MDKKIILNKLDFMIVGSIYFTSFSIFISIAAINAGVILTILCFLFKLILKNDIIKEYNYQGLLLSTSIFVSSIFFSGFNNWNNEILSNKFLFSVIFFFILINEIKKKKELKIIIYLLVISAIIASFYGIYEYFFLNYSRIGSFSFSLSFGNMIAIMVIFFSIYIIWGDYDKKIKFYLLLLDLLFLFNLIFTKSRGAWLGFVGGILVLGFIKSKKLLVIFLIFLSILLLFAPSQYLNRFKSSFDISYDFENNASNAYRIGMWKTAINIIKEYPIFGLGYDNYRTSLSDEYKVEEIKPKGFIHVHNTFLQFGAELGFFGLISFLFLLYSIFKKIIYFYLKCDDRNVKLFYLASLISIVIYIIQGLTQYNFGKTEPLSFFWIIIALNFIVYSLYENKSLGEF